MLSVSPDELENLSGFPNFPPEIRTPPRKSGHNAPMTTTARTTRVPYFAHVTPEIAAHVLWHFGARPGFEPGSFTSQLLAAIAAADPANRERLAYGFPGYVNAYNAAQEWDTGLAMLSELAALIGSDR